MLDLGQMAGDSCGFFCDLIFRGFLNLLKLVLMQGTHGPDSWDFFNISE